MRAKRFLGKDASLDPFLLSLNTVDSLFYIYRTWVVINLLDPGVSSLAALFSHSPLLLLPVFLLSHFSPPLFSFFLFSPPFTTRRRIEQLWSSHSACLRPCNCEINHCHPLFSLSLSLSVPRSLYSLLWNENTPSSLYRRLSWQMVQFETPIVRGFFRFRWMDIEPFGKKRRGKD